MGYLEIFYLSSCPRKPVFSLWKEENSEATENSSTNTIVLNLNWQYLILTFSIILSLNRKLDTSLH